MHVRTSRVSTRWATATLALVVVGAGMAGGSAASASQVPRADNVNVVGYSIAANVYSALEAAFNKTSPGAGVTFSNSFGASTTQATDVVDGQAADVVNFSTAPDMQLLVTSGIVSPRWATGGVGKAEHGMVADSYVVLVTRPGNPLGIRSWGDLTKPGTQVVTPDPTTSGSARWNLLEVYESQIIQKKSAAFAQSFTSTVVHHTVAEPESGSKALTAFLAGTGNVLLAYEADAVAAKASGKQIQIVYPAENIVIQTPAALTATGSTNPGAKAFFAYLFSPAGQTIFARNGFRPTLPSTVSSTAKLFAKTYSAKVLTTIAALGGWNAVTYKYFSANGIITKIEHANGY
jgi:sulfate transport system substrate-binding protein